MSKIKYDFLFKNSFLSKQNSLQNYTSGYDKITGTKLAIIRVGNIHKATFSSIKPWVKD